MNFLEITQAVRILSGTQGTGPATVTNPTGYEVALIAFVKDAWTDIQNYREEWDFLKDSGDFFTVATQDTYAPPNGFKKWDKTSIIITANGKKKYLKYIPLDVFEERYLNEDTLGEPTVFSIDTDDNLVLKLTPDIIYKIDYKYWKEPQALTSDTDVPLCKVSFHNLIVYKALEKMAIYLSSPEIFRNYSVESSRMLAQMMRMDNPKKSFKVRRPFA